jgi:alpha-amylase
MKRFLLPGLLMISLFLTSCARELVTESVTQSLTLAPSETSIPATSAFGPASTETPTPTPIPSPTATLLPYDTPGWFQNAVLYEIFVRSFADSDGDGIGDLEGIAQHLDYLQSLSIDTIWLMPIYPSPSDHGYDVIDYFDVNPDYGTLADLQELVEAVHARQMHLILDFVPSHLSNLNPIFVDAYQNVDSIYSDWFVWTNDAHTAYASFAGSESMPRFNHYNPEVVDYLVEAALFWLDLDSDSDYTDGVDGFRVDNVTFPPQEFFVAFRQGIKAANPEALLLGESWVHNPSDLSRFYENQFGALFDFPFYELIMGHQDSINEGLVNGDGFPVLLTQLLEDEAEKYPSQSMAVRFMSNHDTNRIASKVKSNPDRLRLAAALWAAQDGPVMLYYGEEIGMPGQKGGPPFWDNYRREPMDWYAAEEGPGQPTRFRQPDRWNRPADGISVEEQDGVPASLLTFYRQALESRLNTPALDHGELSILDLEVSGQGPWGFTRFTSDGSVVVALFNFAAESREATIVEFPFSTDSVVDLLSGKEYPASTAGKPYTLELLPASALWLALP